MKENVTISAILLVIFSCVTNFYGSDDKKTNLFIYDSAKTEELQRIMKKLNLLMIFNEPRIQTLLRKLKVSLRIRKPLQTQILQLLEQGADPKKLHILGADGPGLSTAIYFTPKITEFCLQHGYDPNDATTGDSTSLYDVCLTQKYCGQIRTGTHYNNNDFLEKVALLCFFNANPDSKNYREMSPRDILLKCNQEMIPAFDTVIHARDLVTHAKATMRKQKNTPFLTAYLPEPLAHLVNEYDAPHASEMVWDQTCWPIIKQSLPNEKSTSTRITSWRQKLAKHRSPTGMITIEPK